MPAKHRTLRLPEELEARILEEQKRVEASTGVPVSQSAMLLTLIEAGLEARSREKAKNAKPVRGALIEAGLEARANEKMKYAKSVRNR